MGAQSEQKEHTSWKLSEEQKEQIMEWIAIFPSNRDVMSLMKRHGFPEIGTDSVSYYRHKCGPFVEELKERFRKRALEEGWALKEARVALLKGMLGESAEGVHTKEMLAIEKQLSERVDDPKLQRVKLEFDEPKSMEDLMKEIEEDDEGR